MKLTFSKLLRLVICCLLLCAYSSATWTKDILHTPDFLNLSHRNMEYVNATLCDSLPVGSCTASHVDLSHNNIRVLQKNSFTKMLGIRSTPSFLASELNLSFNRIRSIHPEAFSALGRLLRNLSISNNCLTELPSGLISYNIDLYSLDASYNNISYIGKYVFASDQYHLHYVNLSHNKLTYFEPWMHLVRHYELYFDLTHNLINSFNNSLNWKYNLREPYSTLVDMRFNKFVTWKDDYFKQFNQNGNLANDLPTYGLDMRNNSWHCDCNMYHVVQEFHNSLDIHVRIADITCVTPPNLANKRILNEVHLKDLVCNMTEKCPDNCLCQRRPEESLMYINCEGVNLTSLPEELPRLQNGEKYILHLSNNTILQLTSVKYTNMIKELHIDGCNLEEIPSSFVEQSVNLQFISANHNMLKYLPENIQRLAFQNVDVRDNVFLCNCNMTWMSKWMKLSPFYTKDRDISCRYENNRHDIIDVTDQLLGCNNSITIALAVVFGTLLVIVTVSIIWAKRCPYETKVLLFRFFRIHPSDKYAVDRDINTDNMTYVIYDYENIHIRQWVMKRLCKRLEEEKPFYKLFLPQRDLPPGGDRSTDIITNIERSRRVIVVLSENMENNEWTLFEVQRADILPHTGLCL